MRDKISGIAVVITANKTGGVLQFAVQMREVFAKLYEQAVLFLPSDCTMKGKHIRHFARHNSLVPFDPYYKKLAECIAACNPKMVFACESRLMISRMAVFLAKQSPCYLCVHDVRPHPSYRNAAVFWKNTVIQFFSQRAWRACTGIVLLSRKSLGEFQKYYPQHADKCGLIPLGAHVPDVKAKEPRELQGRKKYLLFFGRIEKYKGISILLDAYQKIEKNRPQLVIAGEGIVPEDDKMAMEKSGALLINRYIQDSEMAALFQNCSCVVLPYTEASQSGVLSMAYYFGKPVIVSNLPGLWEFVVHNKTGYIFRSREELKDALVRMSEKSCDMAEAVRCYYGEHMSWEKNVTAWLSSCGENR